MPEPDDAPGVSPDAAEILDGILAFGGHNQFIGAGEKPHAVRQLRAMVAAGHRPTPDALEDYLSGRTKDTGVRRLRGWYETILGGGYLMGDGRRI